MNTAQIHNLELAETLNALTINAPSEDGPTEKTSKKRWPKLLVLVLAIGAAAAYTFREKLPEQITTQFDEALGAVSGVIAPEAEPTTAVAPTTQATSVDQPTTSTMAPMISMREITGSGYVTAPQEATVYAPRGDEIIAVHFDTGDTVEVGAAVVELKGANERFAFEKAEIARGSAALKVEAQEIELEQLRQNFAQTEKLAKRGIVTQKQARDEEMELQVAVNALAQARQVLAQSALDLRIAEHTIEQLVVRAPFSGTITDMRATVGTTTQEGGASEGIENSLMTLVNTADLYIDADFAERNISIFQGDITVEAVLDAFPDKPFDIQLVRIATMASAQKGTITARFGPINPPDGTRPNMAVRIRVTEAAPDKAIERQ
ncbi:MAG: efflux RND transporter periplasmic adaptor subunit [Sulfitobacter sp.]